MNIPPVTIIFANLPAGTATTFLHAGQFRFGLRGPAAVLSDFVVGGIVFDSSGGPWYGSGIDD
jgi:hypothetical protein